MTERPSPGPPDQSRPAGPQGPPPYEYEREVELIDYIEVLLRRKWLIILGTLACVLVVGVYSVMQPRTYQAEALVVVSPAITTASVAKQTGGPAESPTPGSELVVPGLAAQTYQVLARSDALVYALADSLTQHLPADQLEALAGHRAPSPEELGNVLSEALQVELVKATEKAKSPLLVFRYASADERLPVPVVNLWTELFLKRHQGLSSNVTDGFYQQVVSQYKQAKGNLEQAEAELRAIEAGYHELNVLKSEIEFKNTKLDRALQMYQRLQADMEEKQGQLSHTDRVVASLEGGGAWIGYLPAQQAASLPAYKGPDGAMRRDLIELLISLERLAQDSTTVSQRHERELKALRARAQTRTMAFERDRRIDQLRKTRAYLDSTLTQYRQETAALAQRLADSELQLEVRQRNLAKIPEKLVVTKAVTDEALWGKVGKGGKAAASAQKDLGEYGLRTEVLNPIYQSLAAEISKLQVEIDTYTQRRQYLESELPTLQAQQIAVGGQLDSLEVEETALLQELESDSVGVAQSIARERSSSVDALARQRETYAKYREYYTKQKANQESLQREVAELASQISLYRDSFEQFGGDVRGLAGQADSLEQERTRLERNIEVYRQSFERLARLQEEARIARQQASGDIQVVAQATIARGVPRGMGKRVIVTGLMASLALVLLAFLAEHVRKSRAESGALA